MPDSIVRGWHEAALAYGTVFLFMGDDWSSKSNQGGKIACILLI
jgi:hypothetical protein